MISDIEAIYSLFAAIYAQAELIKANKYQFDTLVRNIRVIENAIKTLKNIQKKEHFQEGLRSLQECLKECLEFINQFSSSRYYEYLLNAGIYQNKFETLNKKLLQVNASLQLGIQVQQLFNEEQNKKDQAADLATLDQMRPLIEASYNNSLIANQQIQDLKAGQYILSLQMSALQFQLNQIVTLLQARSVSSPRLQILYYELLFKSFISSDVYGEIYLGEYNGRKVTIKLIHKEISNAELNQFLNDIENTRKLNHANVVSLYGACLDNGHACLVMEHLPGSSLAILQSSFNHSQKIKVAHDIAKGISYLHRKNIIHRNLKSAAILIDEKNNARITDFGFANLGTIRQDHTDSSRYLAPECFSSQANFTMASDIYAFGVILWEIATGQKATLGQTQLDNTDKVNLRLPLDNVAEPFASLIRRCCELDPSKRPYIFEILTLLESDQARPSSPTDIEYYDRGKITQNNRNFTLAFQYYRQAADKGYVKANNKLGCLYNAIEPINKAKALDNFLVAARKKHVRGMMNAATMLEHADGVPKDIPKAYLLYKEILKIQPSNMRAKEGSEKLAAQCADIDFSKLTI